MLQKKIKLTHECYLTARYDANGHLNKDQTVRDKRQDTLRWLSVLRFCTSECVWIFTCTVPHRRHHKRHV